MSKSERHYIVLKNGDRIEYPAPESWEYVDTKKLNKSKRSLKNMVMYLYNHVMGRKQQQI